MIPTSNKDGGCFNMDFRKGFALVLLLSVTVYPAQAENNLWQDIKSTEAKERATTSDNSLPAYQNARFLVLDALQMTDKLKLVSATNLAARNTASNNNALKLDLPLPNGQLITVSVLVDTILPANLMAKYPSIKTFRIIPDNFLVSGKLDITSNGFHASIQTRQGETLFIDPVTLSKSIYASYRKSDQEQVNEIPFSCSANLNGDVLERLSLSTALKTYGRTQDSLLNYRIAIAATGEYTARHGGTIEGALSAIVTTLNRVNQVFEQDLGVHLSLVENNDQLIYQDAQSDPYFSESQGELLAQNQHNIDRVIGSSNYDVGHLFTTNGGGLAAIAGVCSGSRKGQGISGIKNPLSDSFDLDFVAHEIGHQLGATHTFNGSQGLCSGDTRTARTAFEPGSGSSIMSYAGYCGQDNLQTNTDAMFHIGSIQQVRSFLTTGRGAQCGTYSQPENSSPQVNAGNNHSIPAGTPFELEGEAIDPDNDQMVYTWEQVDAGERSPENLDRGDNALFRIHMPSASKKRSFPPILDIITHSTKRGENLPIQQRQLSFRFVAQDGYNTPKSDEISVQVQRTGSRFALNLPRSQYALGDTHRILWNVADTDKAPINCESVDILLSEDDGYHFPHMVGENLPNSGEAWVTMPSNITPTSRGRFKISCSNNIFFALSYRNFLLNYDEHSERLILDDEDQPEKDLKDRSLNENATTNPSSSSTSTVKAGSLDWFLILLLLVFLGRNKELFFYNRSV